MAVGSGPSRGIGGGGSSSYNYRSVPGSSSVGNWNTGGSNYGYGNAGGITRYAPPGLARLPGQINPSGYSPPPGAPPEPAMQPPPGLPGTPGWQWRQSYMPYTAGVRPFMNWNNFAGTWPGAQHVTKDRQGGVGYGYGGGGGSGW